MNNIKNFVFSYWYVFFFGLMIYEFFMSKWGYVYKILL